MTSFIINDNDIPLNLYGKDGEYKIFPDVGEEIIGGYLSCIRQENKDESFFNQSINRLDTPMINDIKYPLTGRVLDINVYCNKQLKDMRLKSHFLFFFCLQQLPKVVL